MGQPKNAEKTAKEKVHFNNLVIRQLVEKWKLEDEESLNKMIFLQEHNFELEKLLLMKIRDKTTRMRFELESLIRNV